MSNGRQAAIQVGLNISDVLQAHRHADQPLADTGRISLRGCQTSVRGAGRVGEQGLGVTKVGAQGQGLQGIEHMESARTRLIRHRWT
jgi:phage tail tape-measure protein